MGKGDVNFKRAGKPKDKTPGHPNKGNYSAVAGKGKAPMNLAGQLRLPKSPKIPAVPRTEGNTSTA